MSPIRKNAYKVNSLKALFYGFCEELLKKIEDSTKKLNKQYQKASKEKVGYRNAPVILRGVENIIINSYDSYSSRKIEKGTWIVNTF